MKHYRASSLILSIVAWSIVATMLPNTVTARQRAVGMTEEIVGIVTQSSSSSLTIRTSKDDRVVHLTSTTIVRVDDQPGSLSSIAAGDKVEAHAQKGTDGTSTALVIQVESHPTTEIEGTVHSLTATSLTITTSAGDVAVTLTADTRFFVNGVTATPTGIHAGDHVEAEVREQADKTLTALVVRVEIETVHLRGTISVATASSITVKTSTGDVVVGLTSSTLIRMQGKVVNASFLVAGSRVEVEAVRKAGQTLAAVTINVETADSLSEVEGSVTEAGSDHLRVHTRSGDDITIAVNTDTIIRKADRMIGLSDIRVGDRVSVDARVNSGSFTALRIVVESEPGNGGGGGETSVDLTGVIASISSGSITVTAGGKTVQVKISTVTVIRRGSTTLTPSDLKVGNQVEVKGQLSSDGSVAATLIQVEDGGSGTPHPEAVEFSGTVTAVSATSLTVDTKKVTVSSTTVVRRGDRTISLSEIRAGQHVEVHANRLADGSLVATRITVEDH